MFSVDLDKINSSEPVIYDHGFSPEDVIEITNNYKSLDARDLSILPVSLEEFKTIVVPYLRISRTEVFNLKKEKVKEKKIREPKEPKVPKEKKLTKKAIKEQTNKLIMKQITGESFTEEEQIFWNAYCEMSL